jgi:hypothetical protein
MKFLPQDLHDEVSILAAVEALLIETGAALSACRDIVLSRETQLEAAGQTK